MLILYFVLFCSLQVVGRGAKKKLSMEQTLVRYIRSLANGTLIIFETVTVVDLRLASHLFSFDSIDFRFPPNRPFLSGLYSVFRDIRHTFYYSHGGNKLLCCSSVIEKRGRRPNRFHREAKVEISEVLQQLVFILLQSFIRQYW